MSEDYEREIFGSSGVVDEIGVVTHTVPYYAKTREECLTVARGRRVDGVPEKTRSYSHFEGGLYTVTVIYEGQKEPGSDPKDIQYSLRGSYEEEAIEANPQIKELMKKYGGVLKDGRVVFDPTYQEAASSGLGLLKGDSAEKKNPMFGVEQYKKLGVVWQRTYAVSAIPSGLLTKVGKVIDSPPGSPPELKGRTKWLMMPPTANIRGNVTEVTEEYFLLDEEIADGVYKQESDIT